MRENPNKFPFSDESLAPSQDYDREARQKDGFLDPLCDSPLKIESIETAGRAQRESRLMPKHSIRFTIESPQFITTGFDPLLGHENVTPDNIKKGNALVPYSKVKRILQMTSPNKSRKKVDTITLNTLTFLSN